MIVKLNLSIRKNLLNSHFLRNNIRLEPKYGEKSRSGTEDKVSAPHHKTARIIFRFWII